METSSPERAENWRLSPLGKSNPNPSHNSGTQMIRVWRVCETDMEVKVKISRHKLAPDDGTKHQNPYSTDRVFGIAVELSHLVL